MIIKYHISMLINCFDISDYYPNNSDIHLLKKKKKKWYSSNYFANNNGRFDDKFLNFP